MSKKPPVNELEFLKLSANHLDLARKLSTLGFLTPDLYQNAQYVCESWFRLGEEHLAEAKNLLSVGCPRSVYSRAYYAAYNASKGTRYIAQGFVSLKGDDHGKASTELPGNFPNIATWASRISILYEHRLHADYDNWSNTSEGFTLTPANAIAEAEAFINVARTYLNTNCGMTL